MILGKWKKFCRLTNLDKAAALCERFAQEHIRYKLYAEDNISQNMGSASIACKMSLGNPAGKAITESFSSPKSSDYLFKVHRKDYKRAVSLN